MGRPKIEVTEEIIKQVESHAARGLTNDQIALCLGWSPETLYAKKRAYSQFSDAIKRGKAQGIKLVSNALFNDAVSGNTTAQIFYLKARDKKNWNESVLGDLEIGEPLSITFGVAQPVSDIKITKPEDLEE